MVKSRRIATDKHNLHTQTLPPNYLFAPDADDDTLTQLDILLAGPSHTPFEAGCWRLHLDIPDNYPTQPPIANFRTPIFHPNVDAQTGGVCVETLKRDWDSKLTLRDVLITISCLLIQPNPDSALNADAGSLIQEDYEMFARRARLLTSIHARVPEHIAEAVHEARTRGQEIEVHEEARNTRGQAPIRQRRTIVGSRARYQTRRSDGSPTNSLLDRRQQSRQPQTDPFKCSSDESMSEAGQENHVSFETPDLHASTSTPRRPPGPTVPLQELVMSSSDDDMEVEYPPSPRKSPRKSPVKRQLFNTRPESSTAAQMRQGQGTPQNLTDTPMHAFTSQLDITFGYETASRTLSPVKMEVETTEAQDSLDSERLWIACDRDIQRWNRGDFASRPFEMIAARW